jgi:hypothetical protein
VSISVVKCSWVKCSGVLKCSDAHSTFLSSKFRLFHNVTFFGSCIIHILHTGCVKI